MSSASSERKEKFVHGVFESIASKYDIMNSVLSFRRHKAWRKFTMKKMNMQKGQTAVDLCCGTCDWTIGMAEASQTGTIAGLDFSEKMLQIGEEKVAKLGLQHQIALTHGNAMELPYEDNSFDFATIGFGLRNVPDIHQVLREMQRVVKPGGKVICLELSKPTWKPFRMVYYFYFQRVLPIIGKLLVRSYEQYKWLPQSLAQFPDHKQLAEVFTEIGLQHVEAHPLTGGIAALHIGQKRS